MVHFDAECTDYDCQQDQGHRGDCCEWADGNLFEHTVTKLQPQRPNIAVTEEALYLAEEVCSEVEKIRGGNVTLHDGILYAAGEGDFSFKGGFSDRME